MAYCDKCNRGFVHDHAYKQHLEKSSAHYFCQLCDRDFSSYHSRLQHFKTSSQHDYCTFCEEEFQDQDDLNNHIDEDHGQCDSCNILFRTPGDLDEHNVENHHYCAPCTRFFCNQNAINMHMQSSVHQPKNIICPGRGCGQKFISPSHLTLHLEAGRCPSGVTRQIVDRTATRMDRGNIITNPNRLIRGTNENEDGVIQQWATPASWNGDAYECCLCYREFRTLNALNAHLQSPAHAERIYQCPQGHYGCGKEFGTLSGLLQHVESGNCDVKRFQRSIRDVFDDITSGMGRLTFG